MKYYYKNEVFMMKVRTCIALLLATAFLMAMLAGCGGETNKPEESSSTAGQTQPTNPNSDPTEPTEESKPNADPTEPTEKPNNQIKPNGVIEDFENGLPAGAEFYAPNTVPRVEKAANGSYVLAGQYSVEGMTAWHGVINANYDLGQSVNQLQFTFVEAAATHVPLTASNIWFDTDVGGLYPTEVSIDGNVYTVTFDQSFTLIKTFALEINSDMMIVWIDDLRIVTNDSN